MSEDDPPPHGFVWDNDAHGDAHMVFGGPAGLPTDGETDENVTAVQMNLPADLADEVIELYDALDQEFYQQYGEQLEPNQLFWANGVQVMLDNADELRANIGIK